MPFGFAGEEERGHYLPAVPHAAQPKRKLLETGDCDMDAFNMELNDCPSKRLCREMFPDPAGDNGVVIAPQIHAPLNLSQPALWQAERAVDHNMNGDVHGCLKDVCGAAPLRASPSHWGGQNLSPSPFSHSCSNVLPSPLLQCQPSTPPSHFSTSQPRQAQLSPMLMDGETYNSDAQDVYDMNGIMGMESDYCPNPVQYQKSPEYCSSNCRGGERSPVSNMIQCGCVDWTSRGSPYKSDYY